MKNELGEVIETPSQMFDRVAKQVAQVDQTYGVDQKEIELNQKAFYETMVNLEFMPNSPTLMNAGRSLGQLSACFVLPIKDTMESIFETLKTAAIIHKSGGGTGFSFSQLREKDSIVKKTGGVASGPVSFLKVFDAATQAVKQGGTRRGANMGILRVDHPDILEFIACKQKDKEISNFNISVAITDEFWTALRDQKEYDLISPYTNSSVGRLHAQEVFNLIVDNAYRNGEPGIIFIDRMNAFNPTPLLGNYEATNPCGEQVLLPYESCNLGSINLLNMLDCAQRCFRIDWDKLTRTVHLAVHFLDNIIDANHHPVAEIEQQTRLIRKIGLGVMGWASMLARLGIPYNSQDAIDLATKVMEHVQKEAQNKSRMLASERGVFPAFANSIYITRGPLSSYRNATVTTIAPTGTISIIAGPCSSGIEPIFAVSFYRNVMDKTRLVETDPVFEQVAKERGFYSTALMQRIADTGSIQSIDEIPEDVKRVFVTAHDISPQWHIKMQAAFQKYTDNAVSKTINCPHDATKEDIKEAFFLAYQLGCKGLTVYRDGSRDDQVLNITKVKKQEESLSLTAAQLRSENDLNDRAVSSGPIEPKPRPEMMMGTTAKVMTGCGNLYVTINRDEQQNPFEVFIQMGKAGGCASSQLEAIGRLISLSMRSGVDSKIITEQLRGIRCPVSSWSHGKRILSCSDAISQVLEKQCPPTKQNNLPLELTDQAANLVPVSYKSKGNMVGVCVDCGNPLHHEEGCLKCHGCGYSRC